MFLCMSGNLLLRKGPVVPRMKLFRLTIVSADSSSADPPNFHLRCQGRIGQGWRQERLEWIA